MRKGAFIILGLLMLTGAAPLLAQGLSGCIFGTTTPPTGNTLNTLAISNTSIPGGQAQGYPVGIVTNTTSGSTVTISAQSVPNAFQLAYLGGNAWQVQVGTVPVSSSTITFTETLAGKSNSPNTGSPITITETYTNYYVASAAHGGNDGNNGLSTSTPWLTLAKVNTGPPGGYPIASVINFNGGDTFSDNCLVFTGGLGGNVANGTTIVQSYGTGNATISPGGTGCTGNFSAAITVNTVTGFTIESLNITGQTTTDGPGNYNYYYPSVGSGTGSTSGSNASVATEFTFNTTGAITSLKYFKMSGDTTTSRTLILWACATGTTCTSGGTNVASCTTSSEPNASQWVSCSITSYTVSSNTGYWLTVNIFSGLPDSYCGSITCPTPNSQIDINIVNLGDATALNTFPTATFSGNGWLMDVTFDATGSTTKPTTSIGVFVGGPATNVSIIGSNISNFGQLGTNNEGEILYSAYGGLISNLNILNNNLFGISPTSIDAAGVNGYGGPESYYSITNLLISGNTVYNLGGSTTAGTYGIELADVGGATVEHNLCHHLGANQQSGSGGSGCFVTYQTNNATIAYNECHNVGPSGVVLADNDCVDADIDSSNIIVEYNYSHNNGGPGFETYQSHDTTGYAWGPVTFRFNISENDAQISNTGAFQTSFSNPAGVLKFYNNSIYMSSGPISGVSYCIKDSSTNTWPSGSEIVGNQCTISTNFFLQFVACCAESANQGITWNYNNYYNYGGATSQWTTYYPSQQSWTTLAAWQSQTGQDASATSVNPQFTNAGGGGTCTWTPANLTGPQPCPTAYELLTASTTKAVGANLLACPVGGSSSTLGATDYFLSSILSICGS